MNTPWHRLLSAAEDHCLNDSELQEFQNHLDSLSKRVQTYERLRDLEISIFQEVAEQVGGIQGYTRDSLKLVLSQGISCYRYASMAMLLSDPSFLRYRLLEWLAPTVQAQDIQVIQALFTSLQTQLEASLPEQQLLLFNPYLEMVVESFVPVDVSITV
jgi:hypothetical protein